MTNTSVVPASQAGNETRAEQQLSDLVAAVHAQYPDTLADYAPKDYRDNYGDMITAPKPDSRLKEADAWLYQQVAGRGSFLFLSFDEDNGGFDPEFSEVRICQFSDDDGPDVLAELAKYNISLMKAVELLTKYWPENAGGRDVYVRMVPVLHAELMPLVRGEHYCSNEEACAWSTGPSATGTSSMTRLHKRPICNLWRVMPWEL